MESTVLGTGTKDGPDWKGNMEQVFKPCRYGEGREFWAEEITRTNSLKWGYVGNGPAWFQKL